MSVGESSSLKINRQKGLIHQLEEHGPFDVIGDIHGCYDELQALLRMLGYEVKDGDEISHPEGRKIIFVGDLVDRGPKNPEVLSLVIAIVTSGMGFCVCGNHDDKLRRKLQGRDVKITNGLEETLGQLDPYPQTFKDKVRSFLEYLPHHHVLDQGKLVIAHAGILERYMGVDTAIVRAFCLYGPTAGKVDESGLPIRYPWAQEYHGKSMIVYGHTPISRPQWVNNTINIDTGCVYGHQLTALRYPERQLISVQALKTYYYPKRPFMTSHETVSG